MIAVHRLKEAHTRCQHINLVTVLFKIGIRILKGRFLPLVIRIKEGDVPAFGIINAHITGGGHAAVFLVDISDVLRIA